jgi:hypothetical protein
MRIASLLLSPKAIPQNSTAARSRCSRGSSMSWSAPSSALPFFITKRGHRDLSGLPDLVWEFPRVSASQLRLDFRSARQPLPDANWIATLQPELSSGFFRPAYDQGPCLAFLGRSRTQKGLEIPSTSRAPLESHCALPQNAESGDGLLKKRIEPHIHDEMVQLGEWTSPPDLPSPGQQRVRSH